MPELVVRDSLEPPRWGVIHPIHMAGWEAFGVVGGSELIVRRLGSGYDGKGELGTEKFHKSEVRDGVSSIEIHTHADHPGGAYIYVLGTQEAAVRNRWHAAAAAFLSIGGELWPTK